MATRVSHPIFARFYGVMSAGAEKAGAAEHRRELLSGLRGRVIEPGAGNGLNFAHYPSVATGVASPGFLFLALMCTAMMAMMMRGMNYGDKGM
jgi:hypothetical protein